MNLGYKIAVAYGLLLLGSPSYALDDEIPELAKAMQRRSHEFHEALGRHGNYRHLSGVVEELEEAARNFRFATVDGSQAFPKASICRLWRGVQGGMLHMRSDFYAAHRAHHDRQIRRSYLEIYTTYETLYLEMLGQCVDIPADGHDEGDDHRHGRRGSGQRDDHDH